MGGVKDHLPHGDGSQFAFAKPGQHQRLVDQVRSAQASIAATSSAFLASRAAPIGCGVEVFGGKR